MGRLVASEPDFVRDFLRVLPYVALLTQIIYFRLQVSLESTLILSQ